MATRFQLGEKVSFTHAVEKVRKDGSTTWERTELPVLRNAWNEGETVNEGIVIGQRSLSDYNYHKETEFGEYGVDLGSWVEVETVVNTSRKAWLIAYNLRRKPVLVFDEDVTPLASIDNSDGNP